MPKGNSEDISYDGTNPTLQTTPTWAGGNGITTSLFPISDASNNTITVDYTGPATNPFRVFGGVSQSENVSGNKVTMLNGTITDRIYGGFAHGAGMTATHNSVIMSGGSAVRVFGGHSTNGDATQNSVSVSSTANITGGYVIGGFSMNQNAKDNRVAIAGGTVGSAGNAFVMGGWVGVGTGEASGNEVALSDGNVDGNVYGAYSNASGTLFNNRIVANGGTVANSVYGAYSNTGATVSGNHVLIDGTTISEHVWGASSNGVGVATDNKVVMKSGSVKQIIGGQSITGNVAGNAVEVHGGTVNHTVVGGMAFTSGKVEGNTVLVEGGSFALSASIHGGWTYTGTATGNVVTINGGTGLARVSGGRSDGGGEASGNIVNIAGGTFVDDGNGIIYGGYTTNNSGTGADAAINNTVNLSGSSLLENVRIYGGYDDSLVNDARTGNTLNVNGFSGSVATVNNFENYNFHIASNLQSGAVILDISGTTAIATDLDGANITMTGVESGAALATGNSGCPLHC